MGGKREENKKSENDRRRGRRRGGRVSRKTSERGEGKMINKI